MSLFFVTKPWKQAQPKEKGHRYEDPEDLSRIICYLGQYILFLVDNMLCFSSPFINLHMWLKRYSISHPPPTADTCGYRNLLSPANADPRNLVDEALRRLVARRLPRGAGSTAACGRWPRPRTEHLVPELFVAGWTAPKLGRRVVLSCRSVRDRACNPGTRQLGMITLMAGPDHRACTGELAVCCLL
jgi:hypothetical protein